MDRIKLGVVHLALPQGEIPFNGLASSSTNSWSPVTPDLLTCIAPESELTSVLVGLLLDPGIRFEAQCQIIEDALVVRCSLVPSDGQGSDWRRKGKGSRMKLLKRLFYELRTGWDGERGQDWVLATNEEDQYRIQDLYARIPSPVTPSAEDWTPLSYGDADTQSRLLGQGDLMGLRTSLYKYQNRSVNRMVQMEMDPKRLIDPRLTRFKQAGASGSDYYVNLTTFDIQLYPGRYDMPRGGILCEQMGTGKTLMCLSSILATLHQPTQPPPYEIDLSPIVTQHMLDTYPFPNVQAIRDRCWPEGVKHVEDSLALPSLAQTCANMLACRDQSVDIESSHVKNQLSTLIKQKTFYLKYPADTSWMRNVRAASTQSTAERIYLANSTLVVVPPILVDQWMQEIDKHVEADALRVLRVGSEDLPKIVELLGYDIILMDVKRFGQEDTVNRARMDLPPSPILSVRWKRIILDEGHVAGGGDRSSNAMSLAKMLNVERRWAITGTPTKHLQQGGEMQIASMGLRPSIEAESNPPLGKAVSHSRSWSRRDLDDVSRFGTIISDFLATQPFRSDIAFSETVTSHLRRKQIPYGAVRRLRYLMNSLMVKHRNPEIDIEASLPPSTLETVVIPFEPMQRITYNVLASLIAANVYTSNFEDADYLLHSKNNKFLRQVVQNLHTACTWYAGTQTLAADSLDRLQEYLHRKWDQHLEDEARDTLTEAVGHLQRAISTPGWSEWIRYGLLVPVHVPSLPVDIRTAWSESRGKDVEWVDAGSLRELAERNTNGTSIESLVAAGIAAVEDKVTSADAEDLRADSMLAAKQQKKVDKPGLTVVPVAAARAPPKVSTRKQFSSKSPAKSDRTDAKLAQAAHNAQVANDHLARAHLPRPMPDEIEIKTRSHKINYVVQAIRSSGINDRFVIFGDVLEIGLLTEVLELMDIDSVAAGSFVSAKGQSEALDRFLKTNIKVIMLDVKIAARGLNLVVANRMIILSPMWSLDTQAQAIKRIHRIGQTRETKIEILVTEGTFEEDIAKRASTSRTEQDEKVYSRDLIEHPRFVYAEQDSARRFTVRLMPKGTKPTDPTTTLTPPVTTSPGVSTPDTNLVTPAGTDLGTTIAGALAPVSTRDGSTTPTPTPVHLHSVLKRPGPAGDETFAPPQKAKKARVAFI